MIDPKFKVKLNSVRLEALGDAIFAVAMTILVLEIKIPPINGSGWHAFAEAMHHSLIELMCFAISFIVLGIMWFGHRMIFEYIGKTNRYFIFLGVLFYMIICLVPFSTKLLATSTLEWYAILIYGVNLSLCNLTLYLQWTYGVKHAGLLERELPEEVRKEANRLFLLSPVVYAGAIIISFWFPVVSIIIFIITPVLYLLPGKLDKYLP